MSTQPSVDVFARFDLADRMRRTLRVTGISVQDMADYLGVGRNTVGNWINGRITPDRRTLIAWALRTGASMEWLEAGQTQLTPPPDGEGVGAEWCTPRDSNPEPID